MSSRFLRCRAAGGEGAAAERPFGVFAVILIIKNSKKIFLKMI
jgi:hypothetical protein